MNIYSLFLSPIGFLNFILIYDTTRLIWCNWHEKGESYYDIIQQAAFILITLPILFRF